MDFGKWALNNTKLVSFMIVVLIVGGFLSYLKMPKLEDPAIKVRQAMIVTTYPGASAHQVELEVTDPLEKSIGEMTTINNINDDLVCPRIQCIFNQFFDNTGGFFNHFASGDLINQKIRQNTYRHFNL